METKVRLTSSGIIAVPDEGCQWEIEGLSVRCLRRDWQHRFDAHAEGPLMTLGWVALISGWSGFWCAVIGLIVWLS